MINYMLIANIQGKVRLARYYKEVGFDDRKQIENNVVKLCLARKKTQSTIVDYEDYVVVYRRYGNIIFIAGITLDENELAVMEVFHLLLETLMKHFKELSELHIMYNLDKVHIIMDEVIMNGLIVETSQPRILAPLHLMMSSKK